MDDLRTSITQGYGGSRTCQLLAGNNFPQISKIDESGPHPTTFEINVMIPLERVRALQE